MKIGLPKIKYVICILVFGGVSWFAQILMYGNAVTQAASSPNDAVNKEDQGWKLLIDLVIPVPVSDSGFKPAWEQECLGWKAKCDPDLMLSADCPSTKSENFLFPGVSPQMSTVKDRGPNLGMSSVFYNKTAVDWIKNNHLNQSSQLKTYLDAHPPRVPKFLNGSEIVKTIWQVAYRDDNIPKGDPRIGPIRIFDPTVVQDLGGGRLDHLINWHSIVYLDAKMKSCPPGDPDLRSSIPLGCFYHVPLDKCAGIFIGNAEEPVGEIPLSTLPCELVLVGVSIAVVQDNNWEWTTFWWTNRAIELGDQAQKKAALQLPAAFRHFMMSSTLGGGTPQNSAYPRAVFNPYLEGTQPGGTRSNCIHCHSKAIYIPTTMPPCPEGSSCLPAVRDNDESLVHKIILNDSVDESSPDTTKGVYTDFIWSLSTGQSPSNSTTGHPVASRRQN